MKFLCVPCDSPMKLQSVGPPDGGSLSVVYSCPECGYEMAMLTNAYKTQIVQSMGVGSVLPPHRMLVQAPPTLPPLRKARRRERRRAAARSPA